MKDFRKLQVWDKAHRLALDVYRVTQSFPKAELYGLPSQMRRAASSIPTNIAEDCGRSGDAELARFSQMAMGSASELEYLVLLARDLEYLDNPNYERLMSQVIEVKRMLTSFIQTLRAER